MVTFPGQISSIIYELGEPEKAKRYTSIEIEAKLRVN